MCVKKLLTILSIFANAVLCHAQNKNSTDTLPAPYATKSSMNFSKVIGWGDKMPIAPAGFTVSRYADGFQNPRWMYVTSNADILVAESNSNFTLVQKAAAVVVGANRADDLTRSADRITILRDTDNDGKPDFKDTLLTGLSQPFGMLVMGDWLYVANTDAIVRFPYKVGQTRITEKGEKIMDLPNGKINQHWTRNIIANADNSKIYVAVGSGTNVAEKGFENEVLRANVLEINPDGTGMKVYGSGLRNPVGMDWAPGTSTLWVAVNERDELGDNLVPDYLTGIKPGGFYGWPYSYFGQHVDPRIKEQQPELVKKAIVPDVDLGPHTASLGLLFYTKKAFPQQYQGAAFVAQHGSWNRSVLSGYKVVYVPFANGKPSGKPKDFLTGFIAELSKEKVHGRPVGLAMLPDGSLLVTDDVSNVIWKVSANK